MPWDYTVKKRQSLVFDGIVTEEELVFYYFAAIEEVH